MAESFDIESSDGEKLTALVLNNDEIQFLYTVLRRVTAFGQNEHLSDLKTELHLCGMKNVKFSEVKGSGIICMCNECASGKGSCDAMRYSL